MLKQVEIRCLRAFVLRKKREFSGTEPLVAEDYNRFPTKLCSEFYDIFQNNAFLKNILIPIFVQNHKSVSFLIYLLAWPEDNQ